MRLVLTLAAAAFLAAASPAVAQTPAFTPREESPEQWPAGEGRDETFYKCTACHGSGVVVRLGQTREGWNDLIDQMITRHNMNAPDDEFRKVLLDYLAAAFPPQQRPQGGWRNPFAPN